MICGTIPQPFELKQFEAVRKPSTKTGTLENKIVGRLTSTTDTAGKTA